MNPLYTPPAIDWLITSPILLISLGGVVALLLAMFRPKADNSLVIWVSLLSLLATGFSLGSQLTLPEASTFGDMLYRDRLGLISQLLIVACTFVVILFSEQYLRARRIPFSEFYPLALWSTAGALMMVSTKSLLMVFIGLEVLSIALYVMAGMAKQEHRSEESAIKYFLLGSFASAWFLLGVAYLFGATGSLSLEALPGATTVTDPMVRGPLLFGFALLLIGLMFKAALAPFHQWAPDVYQGAPINVTAFMATVSKIAAVVTLMRVLDHALPLKDFTIPILTIVAMLTMIVGNVGALAQSDVKRLMGYSSVANAGYLLVAIIAHVKAPDQVSIATTLFFLVAYASTTLGVFAVLTLAAKNGREGTSLADLNGLYHREPMSAICLAICGFSLIGVPPLAGFWGKMWVFQDAIIAEQLPLAVVLAITSIISIGYYLKIIRATWVDEPVGEVTTRPVLPASAKLAVYACTGIVVLLMLLQTPITKFISGEPESPQVSLTHR